MRDLLLDDIVYVEDARECNMVVFNLDNLPVS